MKNRNCFIIISTLLSLMLCACNEENVSSSSINSSKLTVNDAKTFFETSIQKNILQKSLSRGINTEEEDIPEFTGLTPVNFTPIWNNAVVTVNEKACFVNIPIVTLEKYHVQGKSSKNMISLRMMQYQCIVLQKEEVVVVPDLILFVRIAERCYVIVTVHTTTIRTRVIRIVPFVSLIILNLAHVLYVVI